MLWYNSRQRRDYELDTEDRGDCRNDIALRVRRRGKASSPPPETRVPTKHAVRSATIVFLVMNDNAIAIIAGMSDIQPIVSSSIIRPPIFTFAYFLQLFLCHTEKLIKNRSFGSFFKDNWQNRWFFIDLTAENAHFRAFFIAQKWAFIYRSANIKKPALSDFLWLGRSSIFYLLNIFIFSILSKASFSFSTDTVQHSLRWPSPQAKALPLPLTPLSSSVRQR